MTRDRKVDPASYQVITSYFIHIGLVPYNKGSGTGFNIKIHIGRGWKGDFEMDESLKHVLYISKQILLEDS